MFRIDSDVVVDATMAGGPAKLLISEWNGILSSFDIKLEGNNNHEIFSIKKQQFISVTINEQTSSPLGILRFVIIIILLSLSNGTTSATQLGKVF
jgi:hypothetical protein